MKIYNKGKRTFHLSEEHAPNGKVLPGVVTDVNDKAAAALINSYPKELMLFEESRPSAVSKKLNAQIDDLSKKNVALVAEKAELEKKLSESEEEKKALEEQVKNLESEKAELEKTSKDADELLKTSEEEAKAAKEELETAQAEIVTLKAELEAAKASKE